MSGKKCKSFRKKKDNKSPKPFKLSKSSYILALIKKSQFIDWGGTQLADSNIYYIPKKYDGSPCGESCALLAIGKSHWDDLLSSESIVMDFLRHSEELAYIDDIDQLTNKYLYDPLSYFQAFLSRGREDECLLFNIEPKGTGKYEIQYPIPRVCVPGGSMEEDDENSFEKCGFREFREETGFDISSFCCIVATEKVKRQKYKQPKKGGYDFKNFKSKPKHEKKMHMSIFFFVEILQIKGK